MKSILFILPLLIISCSSNKKIKSTTLFSCGNICEGIQDTNLYDSLLNGKYVFRANFRENNIYEIKCQQRIYYVTDSLINIIIPSIKKNNCENIHIKKLNKRDTIDFR